MRTAGMSSPVWSSLQMFCSLRLLILFYSVSVHSTESGLGDVFFHPPSLTTEEGHDVFFQCVSGDSSPPAQISWLKDGKVLTRGNQIQGQYGGGSQRKTSGTLHMANVTKADQGIYVCITHNPLLNISKESHAATLSVHDSSTNIKITEGPQNVTVPVGMEAALHCVVEGFPVPTVQWFKDGHPFLNTSRWSLQRDGQLLLSQRVLSEDKGFYFCEASNERQKVTSQPAYLLPAGIDWTFNLDPANLTVRKGDSAVLPCRPSHSRPQTQVSWFKNNQLLQPGLHYMTDANGDLFFHSVRETDTGLYFCRASNSHVKRAVTSRNIFLAVLEPPSVTIWPGVVRSSEGAEVEVHCQVSGHPAPLIMWSKQGHSVQTGGRIITGVRNSTLYISSVRDYDEGLYTCSATNTLGHDEKTMTLHVAVKPVIVSFIPSITVSEGSPVSLPCRAVGGFPVKYTWIRTALIQKIPEQPGLNTPGLNTSGLNTPGLNTSGLNTPGLNTSGLNSPGVNTPGLNTSGLNSPGLNTSGLNTPGLNTSGLNSPGVNTPGLNTSGLNTPGLNTPGLNTPGLNTPGLNTSGVNTPGLNTSGLNTPGLNTPGLNTPGLNTPGLNTSGVNTPGLNTSGLNTSGLNTPGLNTSGLNTSGVNTSGLNTSGLNTSVLNSSGLNTPVSLPQQMHIDDNGTLVISSIHQADAGEYHCTAENEAGQDMRSTIITVTEPDVMSDKEAPSKKIIPTVLAGSEKMRFTKVNLYDSKTPSYTEIDEPIQPATEDYTKMSFLSAFVEDSPTHSITDSSQDITQFASLKPASLNKRRSEHISGSIETQKTTVVPTNPTAFLKLKETKNTHQHIQPTEPVTTPSVMNMNTQSQSPADSSYAHLKNIQSQTQTSDLTRIDVDNITTSTSVERPNNQSQIIKKAGETRSSVPNDTALVESVKKNTSQAPMRTTDNNAREKDKSQTWLPVIEKHDIPIVVGVGVSLAFIFIAMAFYSLVQKNDPAAVPAGRSALRGIGGPCRHGERLAMERTYDNKAFEDDNLVAVIEQSPNTSETRAVPPETFLSTLGMEPSSSDDQEGVQSNHDLPVIVETHPEPREEEQVESVFEEGKATPSPHSDIQLQCVDDWRSREFEAGQEAPSPPPPNPPAAQEEGLRSSLTLQTSEPCSTPVRHSINISHGFSPLLLSHCVSLGMTSVAVDVHFYPSAPSPASQSPCSAFGPPGQQVNTRLEHELSAPSARHSK